MAPAYVETCVIKKLFLLGLVLLSLAQFARADDFGRRRDRFVDRHPRAAVLTARQRNSFAIARGRVILGPHNRFWWTTHFHTRFVLFAGGYYYFDAGYWYPAYGYDPAYNYYPSAEPIYGYNNLAPGQVLENVQVALRDQGYYRGAVDGLVGPQTRAALAEYQRTHGLVVTAAVDEPTLMTLGLA